MHKFKRTEQKYDVIELQTYHALIKRKKENKGVTNASKKDNVLNTLLTGQNHDKE